MNTSTKLLTRAHSSARLALAALAAALSALVLVGCDHRGERSNQSVRDSGTGASECVEGSFRHPRTKVCTEPGTKEDVYILSGFDKLTRAEPERPVALAASLRNWLSPQDFAHLLADYDVTVPQVHLRLVEYPESTISISLPSGTLPSNLLEVLPDVLESNYGEAWIGPNLTPLREVVPKLRQTHGYELGVAYINFDTASDAMRWYQSHLNAVRIASPIIAEVDNAIMTFLPEEEVQ